MQKTLSIGLLLLLLFQSVGTIILCRLQHIQMQYLSHSINKENHLQIYLNKEQLNSLICENEIVWNNEKYDLINIKQLNSNCFKITAEKDWIETIFSDQISKENNHNNNNLPNSIELKNIHFWPYIIPKQTTNFISNNSIHYHLFPIQLNSNLFAFIIEEPPENSI